jgi:hypothetical protein
MGSTASDERAAVRLADLLVQAGDLEGLLARADAGNWYAAIRLAALLAEAGDDRLLRFGFGADGRWRTAGAGETGAPGRVAWLPAVCRTALRGRGSA